MKLSQGGVRLIFIENHMRIMVALKGPVVINFDVSC